MTSDLTGRQAKPRAASSVETVFAGGGEMGTRLRAISWADSPLGPVESWPQSLITCVRIMLTSRQPMFVWWGDKLINLYNDAYRAILGGKHPTALGQPASVVWHEIWHEIGPRAASAMLKNEGTYDEALHLITERNDYPEETYYTFSYSPVSNDRGEPGGIICANTEDTQRIVGERQLALLRELAVKTAKARTWQEACSLGATCLEGNSRDLPFAMLYVRDPDENQVILAGTSGIEAGHPAAPTNVSLADAAPWPFAEVLRTNRLQLVSVLAARFDSLPTGAWDRSPRRAVVVPIVTGAQRGRTGVMIVGLNPYRLFDDTYRGFLELATSQIAASIANAQAYEDERRRAEALAELDRAKTAFYSNVSHEFRTPLTLMLGPLEDILSQPASDLLPANREALTVVQRNGTRLLRLVNTLLDFARLEAGRVQAVYEPTDLSHLTTELASVFRSSTERAGLRLIVDCPTLSEPVYVDRDMWEKIVLNLVSNAFKSTRDGEIRVSLRQKEKHVELAVQDTGVGIPEAALPHLFERFHRVQGNTQARTHEGSGIGLALVQELVRLHGGTLDVRSVVGQGTTFTVSIPTGRAHLPGDQIGTSRTLTSTAVGAASYVEEALRWLPEESEPNQDASEIGGPRLFATGRFGDRAAESARILLADDNADMRDYVRRLLNQRYEVEAVGDGRVALAAAQARRPDLVLTGVMMPNLDGFGLLQKLREDPGLSTIPVILLAARAGEEAHVEGLQAGADDYLIKPFSARELIARVEAHLALSRQRRASELQIAQLLASERAARQEAEHAVHLRDEFLSIAAHELKTPITSLRAAAQLLLRILDRKGSVDEAYLRRTLPIIEQQSGKLARLVSQLLDVSRIESGKLDLQITNTDL
ncbi:MAG TPA: histidine kinase dimerization/phospho-acceptor domain-containing protein, partial [Chloroflexota bacterium]|nr:histidine kinase dimerization/phospho-acceptor domain-containing protein [Chloroflexota bacterium]